MDLPSRLDVALRGLSAAVDRLESVAALRGGDRSRRAALAQKVDDLKAERNHRSTQRADDARRVEALVRANAEVEARLSGLAATLRVLAVADPPQREQAG